MNKNAMVSMIVGIVGAILSLFLPMEYISGFIIVSSGVVSVIFYNLASKELKKLKDGGVGKGKGQATAGLVLGIINIVMGLMVFLAIYALNDIEIASAIYCPDSTMVRDCTFSDDELSTCKYSGVLDIKCKNEVLEDEQYNK